MSTLIHLELLRGKLTNQPIHVIGEPIVFKGDFFSTETIDDYIESNMMVQVAKSAEITHDGATFLLMHDFNVLVSLTYSTAENRLSWYIDADHLDGLSDHNVNLYGEELSMLTEDGAEALYWNAIDGCYGVGETLPLIADHVDATETTEDILRPIIDTHIQAIGKEAIIKHLKP